MKKISVLTIMMLLTVAAMAAGKQFTLVIDAGHGGNDAGAIGAITKEKIINLNVALAFGKLVEANCKDVKVIYTRKTDMFVPLHTRADIANRAKADLFISIHTNALPKRKISRGIETYTLGMHRAADNLDVAKRENSVILIEKDYKERYQGFDPNSAESYIMFEFIQDRNMAQSVELAKLVQKRTCAATGRQDKGVKQAGFLVLRETSMPSCLIELGFISTPDEERFLNSQRGVQRLSKGIYEAFVDYYKKMVPQPSPKGKIARKLAEARQESMQVMETKEKVAQIEVIQPAENMKETSPVAAVKETAPIAVVKETAPVAAVKETASVTNQENPTVGTGNRADQTASQAPVENTEPKAADKSPAEVTQAPATTTDDKSVATVAEQPAEAKASAAAPVFKVQIVASSTKLKPTDPRLKGQRDADCYEEGGLYKYTLGSSEDYSKIYQLRKTHLKKFPQAFIIAFKDGKRVDVQKAIQEYRSRKAKRK